MLELGSVTNAAAASVGGSRPPDNAAKVKEAAMQFEALLIGQMLKSMHESSSGGWSGSGEDQAGTSLMEMGQERLAEVMAQQGGLGLAGMVTRGLTSTTRAAAPDATGAKR
jgi:Rod binding domain-containing protein